MSHKPRVYIAGPLGFSETTRLFHETVMAAMVERGLKYFNPFCASDELIATLKSPASPERLERLRPLWLAMGRTNEEEILKADIIVACLDGPDVDSGTASEVGFAAGQNKTILAWRNDLRLSGEEGMLTNLQVQYFAQRNGFTVHTCFADLLVTLDALVAQFEEAA